ncbi:MAG: prepilin-type N-terminal cleavage/methylation domain-containing protein [Candidatus Omnitrophota bacterium]
MKLRRLNKKQGFTLVEVVTVVGIVMCLAALSIHGLLRVRVGSNDGAASGSIKSIATAMESYRTVNSSYPNDLATLVNSNPPYISNAYADGNNQGFNFYIPFANANGFAIWAQPEHFSVTGSKFLVYSQRGQERFDSYESAAAYVNDIADTQLASASGIPEVPTGYSEDGKGTTGKQGQPGVDPLGG